MLETLTKGFRTARDRFRGVVELSDANIGGRPLRRGARPSWRADVGPRHRGATSWRKVQERVVGERVRIEAGKKSGQKLRVSPRRSLHEGLLRGADSR